MRRQLQTKNNLWKIGGKKSAVIYRFLMKVNALKNLRAIGKKTSIEFQRLFAMQKTCSNELIIAWLLVDIRVWVWYLTWKFIECFSMRECVPINQLSERVSEHRFDVNWNFNSLRWLHHGKEWQWMHCIRKCDVMWVCTTCMHNKLNLSNSQAINRNGSHPMNVDWLSMLDMMIGHSTHFRHNVFKSYANHTHQTSNQKKLANMLSSLLNQQMEMYSIKWEGFSIWISAFCTSCPSTVCHNSWLMKQQHDGMCSVGSDRRKCISTMFLK